MSLKGTKRFYFPLKSSGKKGELKRRDKVRVIPIQGVYFRNTINRSSSDSFGSSESITSMCKAKEVREQLIKNSSSSSDQSAKQQRNKLKAIVIKLLPKLRIKNSRSKKYKNKENTKDGRCPETSSNSETTDVSHAFISFSENEHSDTDNSSYVTNASSDISIIPHDEPSGSRDCSFEGIPSSSRKTSYDKSNISYTKLDDSIKIQKKNVDDHSIITDYGYETNDTNDSIMTKETASTSTAIHHDTILEDLHKSIDHCINQLEGKLRSVLNRKNSILSNVADTYTARLEDKEIFHKKVERVYDMMLRTANHKVVGFGGYM